MFLLLLSLLLATPENAERPWRLVVADGRVDVAVGKVDPRWENAYVHAWSWNERTAPRRAPIADLGRFADLGEDRGRLRVDVVGLPPKTAAHVICAPLSMWAEVPEDLLPRYAVKDGRADVPWNGEEGWRARLLAKALGSTWVDTRPGEKRLTLTAVPSRSLDLEVTDADGTVLDAVVRILDPLGKREANDRFLSRHQGGTLNVSSVPVDVALKLVAGAPGHVPSGVEGTPASLPPRLVLEKGVTVRGIFVDEDDAPVGGVRVRAEAWAGRRVPEVLRRTAESDASGRFEIAALPRGKAALVAQAEGRAAWQKQVELDGEAHDLGRIVLAKGVRLRLRVVDDLDVPVAGATVAVVGARPGVSDGEGWAELNGLPDGAFDVRAVAEGHLEKKWTLRPPFNEKILRLTRAFVVHGRLADEEGSAVLDATVRVTAGRSDEVRPITADTFTLSLEPGREFDLTFFSPSTAEHRVHVEPGDAGERRDLGELHVTRGRTAVGRLVNGVDAQPVVGARIWTVRPTAPVALFAWYEGDLLETVSNSDGAFEIRGLDERPVTLRIEASGFARREVRVQPTEDGEVRDLGVLELLPGSRVTVLADDPQAEGAIARLDLVGDWLEMDMLTAPVYDSRAVFTHVPPGTFIVSVIDDGPVAYEMLCETKVEVPDDGTDAEAVCGAGGREVRGTVVVGGRPAGPGVVSWSSLDADPPGLIRNQRAPMGLLRQRVFGLGRPQVDVPVASDGFFSTTKLPSGAYSVFWVPEGGSMSETRTVDVPAGDEEVFLTLEFPGFVVRGTVVDSEGEAVEGAEVRDLEANTVTFSRDGGRFRMTGSRPGLRYVKARKGDEQSEPVAVEIVPGEEAPPVVLTLGAERPEGPRITVVDAAGAGVAGAFVFAEAAGRPPRLLTTSGDGSVELLLEPPFPERVRFAAWGRERWSLGNWTAWEEAAEGVVVELGPAGEMSIEGEGTPQILSEGGWDLTLLLTRIGLRPRLQAGEAWRLAGLPPGVYGVHLDGVDRVVHVTEDEAASVSF